LASTATRVGSMTRATMRSSRPVYQQTTRSYASNTPVYNAIMGSNARYVAFCAAGAAVGGVVYNGLFDILFDLNNRGKLYKDIDWSKWDSIYLEEDEDEDEDEEDDE